MKFFTMNKFLTGTLLTILLCLPGIMGAQNKPETPSIEEMATKEADRLATLLKLEDWQVFYVDSTLQHDYAALQEEYEKLQKSKVENTDLYIMVRDKWMDQIDRAYRKFFNDTQWNAYLRSGAAKQQKAREKRKTKIEQSTLAQQNKK